MANSRARFEEALNRGHSYCWDQRWQDAVNEFRTAIELAPKEPAAHAGMGMAFLELDRLSEALDSYKLAARYSRGNIIYLRKVADVQERLDLLGEAGRTYMAIGEVELTRRRLNEAMDNWHRAIRLEPNLLRAHQRLASIYQRQGAVRNAIQEYLAIAQILQRQGEKEKALQSCQLSLQLDPRNPDVLTAIEKIKQDEPIFDEKEPLPSLDSSSTGMTGLLHRMAVDEIDDEELEPQSVETAVPVQDAQRMAMAQLAGGLFDGDDDQFDRRKMEQVRLIGQALEYQRQSKTNEAISAYEQAIYNGENSTAARFNLGLLYQDKLRFDDAIREFEFALNDPAYKLASYFALGESYRARGLIDKAVEYFIKVLKIVDLKTVQHGQADRLIELYENLADSLMTKGEREQASDFANALVDFLSHKGWEDKVKEARRRLDSISDAGMMILGDVLTAGSEQVLESLYLSQEYARRGMYNTAIEETYHAIQLSPDYLPAHIQLAEVLASQGRTEASALKFGVIGDTYRMRGDLSSAAVTYERVAELAPLDLTIRSRLISLLKEQGQIERAMEHYLSMGRAYYQLAQVNKARETYQEALRLVQRSEIDAAWQTRVLHLISDIDMQRLDWKRAVLSYQDLRKLDPEDEEIAMTLVELNFRTGQSISAVRELDKYLSQLVQSGRSTKVVGILEDMVKQRPSDPNLVDRLARLYAQQKRMKEAVGLLDKLGEAQLETGDTQKAIKTIEKIIRLNPPNVASYRQLLNQIKQ